MSDVVDYMLTTVDNPYDPHTQYEDWYAWDDRHGYHTPGALARQAFVGSELSDVDESSAINVAIDELIESNPLGLYKKVSRI